ncbi:hypothetical protein EHI8A_070290 [Entamoeba histolytica HM-1:IMSS-B]|uniref:Peptidase S74 domain-containing protein n=6 Tax=Entamoeba histolytica TaxID=5759 RepID=C4M0C0_ENTH1|nr:hypothetical protein EHI_064510 [Entamoeba histolytica HM-1:IMSS]EMD45397.1 Hypothetical protein EHI5A_026590 [Entamoeba histolytica KU27]EMH72523.1 hypothetical protein EHI8A_070290 [Entamoeba histolytica HM-1:IMSS-B]EMS13426.1 hypothetical protein KM1_128300 [Entamoeba histolytica HM-3:IMSS]ENY63839.1 hypothetical protein EHI7A_066110 [Entamoeba histolytica HM-1:IMSS-A]GAT94599.1 hypothetical protein CL6EHI_064510 [Entamoeba histolytica]|eukprot:XP_654021.1 hypothetical protein EHI_064510 [Entamoeba histolytica HM-1:IMSS]
MKNQTKSPSKQRIRYKDWKCNYPGCNEPAKTKYNCTSHVWDAHLKFIYNEFGGVAFKNLENKQFPKEMCEKYIEFVPDEVNIRKRKYPLVTKQSNKKNESPLITSLVSTNSPNNLIHSSENQVDTLSPPSESLAGHEISDFNDLPPIIQRTSFPQLSQTPQQLFCSTNIDDFIKVLQVSPSLKQLHIFGAVFAENGFFQRSDSRTKTKIAPIRNALERLLNVTGKMYTYDVANAETYGFIAQELKEHFPDLVHEDESGYLSIDPISLIPFTVEAVKELDKEIIPLQNSYSLAVKLLEESNNLLQTINQFTVDFSFSLGPRYITLPSAIIITILSVILSILYPSLPFIWGYFALLSVGLWYSSRSSNVSVKKETTKFGVSGCIVVGIICGSLSFLFGCSVQFIGMYSIVVLIVWTIGQFYGDCLKIFNMFIVISIIFSGIMFILSIIQPGYTCHAGVVDDLIYVNRSPWNCLDPELGFIFENNEIVWLGSKGETLLNPINHQNASIGVVLKCSDFVNFKCGNIYY